MRDSRRLVALCLASLAAAVFFTDSPQARTSTPLILTVRDPASNHAEIIFLPAKQSAKAVTVRTVRIGVAGSRLQLRVDRSRRPLISTILSIGQCKFGDGGSMYEVTVSGKSALNMDFVRAFRLGFMAHLAVETAGVMAMSDSLSLRGFSAAFSLLDPRERLDDVG